MEQKWNALAREAGLAAEHIAIGVTSLGRANYVQNAYYYQAFFALSIGFERSAKLILVVDYVLEHGGIFPEQQRIRNYGHNLKNLFEAIDNIAELKSLSQREGRLPNSLVHKGIIEVLTNFAMNINRYYNLDLISGNPNTRELDDPIFEWYKKVTKPVIETHLCQRTYQRIEANARKVSDILNPHAKVSYTAEDGRVLTDAYDASYQTGIIEYAKQYSRMYVMQIARFASALIFHLTHECYQQRLDYIPHLPEFFAIFNNHDKYFMKRKTWTIY